MTVGLGILGATGKTAFAFVGQRGLRYFTDHPFLEVRAMIADDPEDVGKTAVYLLSEAASFITGQTIIVDGGLSSAMVKAGVGV